MSGALGRTVHSKGSLGEDSTQWVESWGGQYTVGERQHLWEGQNPLRSALQNIVGQYDRQKQMLSIQFTARLHEAK